MIFWCGIFLALSGSALAAAWKKPPELSIPCSLMLNALLLYPAAAAGKMQAGFLMITVLNAACLAAAIWSARRRFRQFSVCFFTSGTAAFLTWSILFYFLNRGRMFCEWDEFSHWGMAAKALFVKNDLHCRFASLMNFPDYPPGMALLQYFYLRFNGSFAEDAVLFATAQLAFSLMLPALHFARRSNKYIVLLYILTAWLIPLAFLEFFYTAYVDGVLAVLWAFGMYQVFCSDRFDIYRSAMLGITLGFMALVKDSGGGLAVTVLAALVFSRIRRPGELLRLLPLPLTAMLICRLSWSYLVRVNQCRPHFAGEPVTWSGICSAVIHNIPGHAHQVIAAWAQALAGISAAAVLVAVYGILIACLCRRRAYICRSLHGAAAAFLLTWATFAVTLLICYIFKFLPYEAVRLASFDRYMNTILLGGYMLILMLSVNAMALCRRPFMPDILIALALLMPLCAGDRIVNRLQSICRRNYGYLRGDKMTGESRWRRVLKPGERIAVLAQCSKGTEAFIMRYTAWGHAVPLPWSVGEEQFDGDIWSRNLSAEEYRAELQKTDYLYIACVNDYFRRRYGVLFENPAEIQEGELYRRDTNGKMTLCRGED